MTEEQVQEKLVVLCLALKDVLDERVDEELRAFNEEQQVVSDPDNTRASCDTRTCVQSAVQIECWWHDCGYTGAFWGCEFVAQYDGVKMQR